jgi:hypothetical protein
MAAVMAAVPVSAIKVYEIRPSQADPGVRRFDEPSYVLYDPSREAFAPLVVFLPGTSGRPSGSGLLLSVVAQLGYRVIGLEYDDTPAVAQVCPRDPDPDCSAQFRQMRVDGAGAFRAVTNPPAEAIIPRLIAALQTLDREHPDQGWSQYLSGDGLRWDRIVVSGLSQGAGMAAYIAQQHKVARVVLFSSPWDVTGSDHRPAPWLHGPNQTPPERWFAEYHAKEKTAALIARAYAALRIPQENIRIFDRGLPPGSGNSENPYHGSTIRNPDYAGDWAAMFGSPSLTSATTAP